MRNFCTRLETIFSAVHSMDLMSVANTKKKKNHSPGISSLSFDVQAFLGVPIRGDRWFCLFVWMSPLPERRLSLFAATFFWPSSGPSGTSFSSVEREFSLVFFAIYYEAQGILGANWLTTGLGSTSTMDRAAGGSGFSQVLPSGRGGVSTQSHRCTKQQLGWCLDWDPASVGRHHTLTTSRCKFWEALETRTSVRVLRS